MRAQVFERIQILLSADLIDPEVADFCRRAVDIILGVKPDADEERFEMLITHLAMGTQRVLNKQEEHPVDAGILDAVKKGPAYEEAEKLAEALIAISGISFSQTESDFLKIHLCNVIS